VRVEDGTFHYQVIALSGEKVIGSIELADTQCPILQLDNPDQLKPYIHEILKKTSERDHTHPQALISAFDTYAYGLKNNWSNEQLVQQWCGGVGMAERFEVAAVVAQQMCREDVVFSDQRHFKEPRFRRTLNFYECTFSSVGKCYSWFSTSGHTRLGLDFGVVNKRDQSHKRAGMACIDGGLGIKARSGVYINSVTLFDLSRVRAIQIAKLRDKLDPANLPEVAVGQGPRLG
jgi:hypothetical protein